MYNKTIKTASFIAALVLSVGILAACNGDQRACASPLSYTVTQNADGSATIDGVLYKGASGGGGGHVSSGGSSSGAHAPSNSGVRSGPSGGPSAGGVKAPTNSGASSGRVQAPSNSGARPASTPLGGTPSKISGSSYTYHGTNGVTHVYTYHPASYWTHLGAPDPYNPFDPRNYNNPFSPYFHHHISC